MITCSQPTGGEEEHMFTWEHIRIRLLVPDTCTILQVVEDPLELGELFVSIKEAAYLQVLAFYRGLYVTLANTLFGIIISWGTYFERHRTTTSFLTSMLFKLSVFYLLNSFVVPIIVAITSSAHGSKHEEVWCAVAKICP
jgi:hypothetical protein